MITLIGDQDWAVPMNRYFPELLAPLAHALPERCVVDGEIVILGPGGLYFEALLLRIHAAASRVMLLAPRSPAAFVARDLLALGDEDLREDPLAVASGARLLTRAYDLGITFWDASDDYGTHPHVAQALREVGRDGVVVATKTYASTAVGARRALTKVLRELGVETVDIFLLHAVDSHGELAAKLPALEALTRAKAEGLVRAVGVSSHSREVLARLLELSEVDVALVVVNRTGAWVKDASPAELTAVVQPLYRSRRGVYGMKALGSGQVTEPRAVASALRYAFD